MQVAAWQARWEAKRQHVSALHARRTMEQDHGRYPVATTVAKDTVTSDTRCIDLSSELTTSSFATTDLTDSYRNVSLLPRELPLSVLGNFQHPAFLPVRLRLCNCLMQCCAAVSLPKSVMIFLQDLSNFILKSPNGPLRWPHLSSGSILLTFLYLDSSKKFTLHSVHCFLTNFL